MANKSILVSAQFSEGETSDVDSRFTHGRDLEDSGRSETSLLLEKSPNLDVRQDFLLSANGDSDSNALASPILVPFNTPAMTPSPSCNGTHAKRNDYASFSSAADACNTMSSLSTTTSSFNVSLMTDNSEEDDELRTSGSFDTLFSPVAVRPSLARGAGLGISGFFKKDGSGPFDGLGLVWNQPPHTRNDLNLGDVFQQIPRSLSSCDRFNSDDDEFSLHAYDSTGNLSNTFLQEALLTFNDDPFHEHTLNSIPECPSWYDLEPVSRAADMASILGESSSSQTSPPWTPHGTLKTRRHFSSATISSELKRSSSTLNTKYGIHASRTRSASWPTDASGSSRSRTGSNHPSTSSPARPALNRVWRV